MGTGEFWGAGTPGTARLATRRYCPRRCQKSGPGIVLVFASVHTHSTTPIQRLFIYWFVCLFTFNWRRHRSWCLPSLSPFRMFMLIHANADNPARKHRQVKGCSTTGLSSETPKRIRLTLSACTFFKAYRPAVSIASSPTTLFSKYGIPQLPAEPHGDAACCLTWQCSPSWQTTN